MKKVNNERIRSVRMDLRMSQEEFARAVGVSSVLINQWENDRVRPSNYAMRTIAKLAKGLSQP